ncbi:MULTISPECIES: TraR/DksA C4-type zinc finger protein [Polymorphospora]|uniref:TraR/DksA C4-type zinc finger protein n=1 Tax=Polymorphospora lycopeni TaxID=3140240 RepID=A0ABV5CY97_9ACTN
MTDTVQDPVERLRVRLEEQFQQYTEQLTELTVHSRQPGRGGHDPDTLNGLLTTARDGLAGTAEALRRMSEGTYGRCDRCGGEIPMGRLEILPHARYCVTCQRA